MSRIRTKARIPIKVGGFSDSNCKVAAARDVIIDLVIAFS